MLLVIEIGNTTAVFAVFSEGACIEACKLSTASLTGQEAIENQLSPFLARYPDLLDTAFCSVVPGLEQPVLDVLGRLLGGRDSRGRIMQVASSLNLPFSLRYDSPSTFGPDRIALCAYSRRRYPGEAVIAIDIGTAITFDVLGSGGDYLGGLIIPGLDLMARSLHEHTARLPIVSISEPVSITGFSTEECIRNGIVWSCAAGIEGLAEKIARRLREEHGEKAARIIATGGNAPLLAGMTALPAEVDELAVLRGTLYLFELNCSGVS
ncbi:MAG: type III pantothenate kinase [Chlorobiaceae bacterium]|nr:type III pantothenate kinase [Chlorobiaceae bacterium]